MDPMPNATATSRIFAKQGARPASRAKKNLWRLGCALMLAGIMLPVISGGFFAIHFLRYPNAPGGSLPLPILLVGLACAGGGKRLMSGWWDGVLTELHVALARAGLAFLVFALRYALDGRPFAPYPGGMLTAVSLAAVVSRLAVRFVGQSAARER